MATPTVGLERRPSHGRDRAGGRRCSGRAARRCRSRNCGRDGRAGGEAARRCGRAMSVERIRPLSSRATWTSAASPAKWPWRSLIGARPLRSIPTTAAAVPWRSAWLTTRSSSARKRRAVGSGGQAVAVGDVLELADRRSRPRQGRREAAHSRREASTRDAPARSARHASDLASPQSIKRDLVKQTAKAALHCLAACRKDALRRVEERGWQRAPSSDHHGQPLRLGDDAPRRRHARRARRAHETKVVSAHRTPERLYDYAKGAAARGLKVIIAGAGGAAHLPGMAASMTRLPVLGVPVEIEGAGRPRQPAVDRPDARRRAGRRRSRSARPARPMPACSPPRSSPLSDEALAGRLEAWRQRQTDGVAEAPE